MLAFGTNTGFEPILPGTVGSKFVSVPKVPGTVGSRFVSVPKADLHHLRSVIMTLKWQIRRTAELFESAR